MVGQKQIPNFGGDGRTLLRLSTSRHSPWARHRLTVAPGGATSLRRSNPPNPTDRLNGSAIKADPFNMRRREDSNLRTGLTRSPL